MKLMQSILIDFDLMDKIDSQYLDGFNRINERHPDAAPGKPRKIIHNRHGLIYEVRIGIAST